MINDHVTLTPRVFSRIFQMFLLVCLSNMHYSHAENNSRVHLFSPRKHTQNSFNTGFFMLPLASGFSHFKKTITINIMSK